MKNSQGDYPAWSLLGGAIYTNADSHTTSDEFRKRMKRRSENLRQNEKKENLNEDSTSGFRCESATARTT